MFRRKNIFPLVLLFLLVFVITTNYLLVWLPRESEVTRVISIEENIYIELKNLPLYYKATPVENGSKNVFQNIISTNSTIKINVDLWKIANSWPNKTQLVDIWSDHLGDILSLLSYAKIIRADLDPRGTQLKLLLTLEGNQQVIFKPKWYDKGKIIDGPVYAGKDRFNSEIIGFYLSVILKKPLCPLSTSRELSLKRDILPVATKRLLATSFIKNNQTCIYGKCFYCSVNDPICDDENSLLEGAVILNINATLISHRSPWQRTYKKDKNAFWQDYPDNYCNLIKMRLTRKRLYDLIDISVFDFLIQNGDRHHYETFDETVLWLDNGKGLGNPFKHHLDILAPLYQCCMLRKSMYNNLFTLRGRLLKELRNIPKIKKLITEDHLKAIDERLLIIFATIEYCKKNKKIILL